MSNWLIKCRSCRETVHPDEPGRRAKLLVVGCGRGGTAFAAEFLRRCGADAGHEEFCKDAMASWFLAVESDTPHACSDGRFVNLKHSDFEHIVHLVRHPLSVIRSWMADPVPANPEQLQFIEAHTSCRFAEQSRLEFAARYWLDWNRLCKEASLPPSVQVECLGNRSVAGLFCRLAGLDGPDMKAFATLGAVNKTESPAPEVTWRQLSDGVPWSLVQQIRAEAEAYGYRL